MALVLVLLTAAAAKPAFLAMGDWGGYDDQHPTSAGQRATADGLERVAKEKGVEAVLLLGDNFYNHGVKSLSSKRFEETFEDVYSDMPAVPFWVIAGNHDHKGNVSAQLEYSTRSSRWNFPEMYYNLTSSDGLVELLMLDTVLLAGPSDDSCLGCPMPGPDMPSLAESQWVWLEERLSRSKADFLWVAGHYPIYSAGSDGTQPMLVQRLLPLLRKYGAHYLSGHDHMLEHIEVDGVNMFVSGAGRECCYDTQHLHTVPDGALRYLLSGPQGRGQRVGPVPRHDVQGGFAALDFADVATVTYYDQRGVELYSARVPKRLRDMVV